MWLFVGFIFTALGIIAQKEKATAFGIIFIIVGISSLIGVFFLKRIVVIIDKNTNTVERYWQTWTGILKKSKSIPIDKIQSIVYEREVGYASPVRKRGIRQHFFLLAEVNDGSEFNFFPSTYTPLSAKNNGQITKAQGQTLNMEFTCFPVLILKFSLVFLRIHMRNAALFTALILTPNSSPTALFVKPVYVSIYTHSHLCPQTVYAFFSVVAWSCLLHNYALSSLLPVQSYLSACHLFQKSRIIVIGKQYLTPTDTSRHNVINCTFVLYSPRPCHNCTL